MFQSERTLRTYANVKCRSLEMQLVLTDFFGQPHNCGPINEKCLFFLAIYSETDPSVFFFSTFFLFTNHIFCPTEKRRIL